MKQVARIWFGSVLLLALGCGSETTSQGDGALSAGSGGAGGAGGGGAIDAPDAPNLDCPELVGPLDGEYAPKGECCYRTANSTRLEAYGDGPAGELEFRLNYTLTTNHPMSLGLESITAATIYRADNTEQSLLWRVKVPRAGGDTVSGPGAATIGTGRYNCDGTYSFYSDRAAPPREISSDPARWMAHEVPTEIDATKQGVDRTRTPWATSVERKFSYVPFVGTTSFELEWELVSQGYKVLETLTGPEHEDCVGGRESGIWRPAGKFRTFSPLAPNDRDVIPSVNQTYCQVLAFGLTAEPPPGEQRPQCRDARCMPGEAGCPWVKLPDGLCPVTEEEQASWSCHVGYENNPDGAVTNCTPEAPTGVLDPDHSATSEGQCCDPLGTSTTLPPCNAYMLINEFVAAAAEITDAPADTLQTDCP